jgi:exosortase
MTRQLSASAQSVAVAFLAALLCLTWVYWPTLGEMAQRWARDPQYSHGYLVPAFALFLMWLRRGHLATGAFRPSWWGMPLLLGGIALRLIGTYYSFVWFEAISLLPCLAGLCLLAGGGKAWRWTWPAIAFLFFMVPLPYRLSDALAGPLQNFATTTSTFLLQVFGLPAIAEGNVIQLHEVELNIVEACSGLRMLVIFFALSTAVALLIRRPLWERILLVLSAIPIALFANVARITVTGVLHETVGSELANAVFHDLAGWLMMPLGLLLLALELKILGHLLLERAAAVPRREAAPPTPGVLPLPVAPRRRRRGQSERAQPRPSPVLGEAAVQP